MSTRAALRQRALEAQASASPGIILDPTCVLELLDELAEYERLEILREREAERMMAMGGKAVR